MNYDLNCDLGENEPRSVTAALMRSITSANIACGGHAGSIETMRAAVKLAMKNNVHVGAHPGFPDRKNFGRSCPQVSAAAFKMLLLHQVGALERIVLNAGGRLHHIKLHGALYHLVEEQLRLREAYLEMVQEFWPEAVIYSFAGGPVAQDSARAGLKNWGEGFLDRGYYDEIRLAPRDTPGSRLDRQEFEARLKRLVQEGTITDIFGSHALNVPAKTWCIHADTTDAIAFAQRARAAFGES